MRQGPLPHGRGPGGRGLHSGRGRHAQQSSPSTARSARLSGPVQRAHGAVSDLEGEASRGVRSKPDHPLGSGCDVVVIDYRLLHATTPNTTERQRACVLLSFAPRWKELPADIRGHLISHLALPRAHAHAPRSYRHNDLLPTFDGLRNDLALNHCPPAHFAIPDGNDVRQSKLTNGRGCRSGAAEHALDSLQSSRSPRRTRTSLTECE